MRVISLSVDGIFQAAKRGLYDWIADQDADIICLQDIRAREYELDDDVFHPQGYFAYFFDSGIKNYNGVAIYTRFQPKALIYGLGFASGVDVEGRYLQIDYDNYSIGTLLAPSARSEAESQEVKIQFFDDFQALLHKISRKRRHFIFCGNWQMAHTSKDVQNPEKNAQQSGFLGHEQLWMRQLFTQLDYTDAFRLAITEGGEYSWWPEGEMGKGDGWRTDYQVISKALAKKVEYASMYKTKTFSSHLPVIVDYDIDDLESIF